MKSLSNIGHWKDFERLCADLLQAEGFHIDSEPSIDTTGADIAAVYDYRSHSTGIPPIRVRWRVQCKHFAPSGDHLGRAEMERALVAFDAVRGAEDGLLLMVSSDYTEPAKEVLRRFMEQRPGVKVMIWNQRQLIDLLDRHGHLQRRYGLDSPPSTTRLLEAVREVNAAGPVLFVSDQSALAHECSAYLRAAGLEIVFLPHWNYSEPARLQLFRETYGNTVFGLCVCFMGDSFGLPFPTELEAIVLQAARRGTPFLFFPFVAWMIQQGALNRISSMVPVRLSIDQASGETFTRTRLLAERRAGDFRWLLAEGTFEEDEYREYDPIDGLSEFIKGVASRFGMSHSFEHLEAIADARVAWADTSGNPLLVVADIDGTRVAYLNSCCHSCLSSRPIPSPLRSSPAFGILLDNAVRWLVEKPSRGTAAETA